MRRRELNFLYILLGLLAIFFSRMIFFGRTYFLGDIMNYFQPWTGFGTEGLQRGYLYLWNPYLCNGEPFLANIQVAMFYPLKILFYLFPFIWAFKAYLLAHFFLCGLFLYLFLKQFRFHPWACFLGAIIFTFSGFMLVQIEFFSVLATLLWFSLVWVILRRALASNGWFYWLTGSLILALQFYSGYTFIFYYTNLLIILYIIWQRHYRFWPQLLLMWSLTIGLIAIQFLPTAELAQYQIRSAWTYTEATTWSLPPLFLIKFILPDLFGKACLPGLFPHPFGTEYFAIRQYWLSTFYLGIMPLLFLILAWRGRKTDYFWEVVALLSLFLSMSAEFPVTRYYYKYMPFAKDFTHPASFMFFFMFALIIFITRGLDTFLNPGFRLKRKAVTIWLLLGTTAYGLIYFLFYQRAWLQHLVGLLIGLDLRASQCVHLEINFFEFSVRLLVAIVLGYWWYRKKEKKAIKYVVVAFMMVDLFAFGWDINPQAPNDFFQEKPPNVEAVRAELDGGRFLLEPEAQSNRLLQGGDFVSEYQSLRQALQPNAGLTYHLPYIYEYGYFTLKDYKDLLLKAKSFPSIMDPPIIDMLGGRVILSYKYLAQRKLRPLGFYYIGFYENKNALPRAWVVHRARFMPRNEVLGYLAGPGFQPAREVVLNSSAADAGVFSLPVTGAADQAEIQQTDPDNLVINGHAAGEGYLVTSDVYYPGWQALVNGQKREIAKANYIISAIPVTAGRYQVTLRYRPFAFYAGLVATLTALLLLSLRALRIKGD